MMGSACPIEWHATNLINTMPDSKCAIKNTPISDRSGKELTQPTNNYNYNYNKQLQSVCLMILMKSHIVIKIRWLKSNWQYTCVRQMSSCHSNCCCCCSCSCHQLLHGRNFKIACISNLDWPELALNVAVISAVEQANGQRSTAYNPPFTPLESPPL